MSFIHTEAAKTFLLKVVSIHFPAFRIKNIISRVGCNKKTPMVQFRHETKMQKTLNSRSKEIKFYHDRKLVAYCDVLANIAFDEYVMSQNIFV